MGKTQTLGRAKIYMDSLQLDTEEGATLQMGGIKNNERKTSYTVGYCQTMTPAKVTCNVQLRPGMSLRDFQEAAEIEITFTSDTGQQYIIRNAFQSGDVGTKDGTDGGSVPLEFTGSAAEEVLN